MKAIPQNVMDAVGSWKSAKNVKHEEIMLLVRQKLIDAIEAKLTGKKRTFSFIRNGNMILRANGDDRKNTALAVMEGTSFHYTHFERYPEGDDYEFYDLFQGIDIHILYIALGALLDEDGFLIDENTDSLTEYASEYASMVGLELSDDEEYDDFVNEAIAFATAVDDARRGLIDEAVKNDDFCGFISDLGSFFDNLLDADYLMKNIAYIGQIICPHASTVRATVIGSSDLYDYSLYRENLPKKVREEADRMVAFYERPFCSEEGGVIYCDSYLDAKERRHVQVMVAFEERDGVYYSIDDAYHPLYLASVRWLISELPKLKEKYGACESAPRLFLCQ